LELLLLLGFPRLVTPSFSLFSSCFARRPVKLYHAHTRQQRGAALVGNARHGMMQLINWNGHKNG
jgi:hypothetical protein